MFYFTEDLAVSVLFIILFGSFTEDNQKGRVLFPKENGKQIPLLGNTFPVGQTAPVCPLKRKAG